MAFKIKVLNTGLRNYTDYNALLRRQVRIGQGASTIIANNGKIEVKDLQKNKISSISCDKKEITPGELVTYTVKLDEKEKDKVKTEIKQVKFCLWFQYRDKKGVLKKLELDKNVTPAGVILVSKRNATPRVTNIFEPRENKGETLTSNLDSAYHFANITYTENEAKLEIKYNKWMDGCRIRVEAYFKQIRQDGLKTTASRWVKSKPEILEAYWMNAEGKRIIQTGYEQNIYLYLKTLGLRNKQIKVNIYDEDYHPAPNIPEKFPLYNDKTGDDLVVWKNNQVKIDYRGEAIKQFKVGDKLRYENAANDEKDNEYKKAVDELGSELLVPLFDYTEKYKDLELYVHIPPSKDIDIDPQNNFGKLILTEKQLISNAFFAEAEKDKKDKTKIQADSAPTKKTKNPTISIDQYIRINKGVLGQTVRLVAECPNLEGKTVSFYVYEKTPLLGEKDKALTLIYKDQEKTRIETKVKNGYAVAEVKLQHCKEDADNEDWRKILDPDKGELKTAELYLKVEATENVFTVINDGEFLKYAPFEFRAATVVYDIYSDGRMEKLICKNPKKVKYYYHESSGIKHFLGKSELIESDKWVSKGVKVKPTLKVKLLDARNIDSYSSGNVKYNIVQWVTSKKRYYINPDCFAGLLGAMIEESVEDLGSTGFSDVNGSPGDSTTHLNGVAGDLRYLSTNKNGERTYLQHSHFDYDRQVEFNNALYKFGWGRTKKMLSEYFNRKVKQEVINPKTKKKEIKEVSVKTLLPHTKHKKYKTKSGIWVRHHHHIHLYGFDFSMVKER